jgi:hypothetical protein
MISYFNHAEVYFYLDSAEDRVAQWMQLLGYGLDDLRIVVRLPAGAKDFLYYKVSRPTPGPTQPPTAWVPETPAHSTNSSQCRG